MRSVAPFDGLLWSDGVQLAVAPFFRPAVLVLWTGFRGCVCQMSLVRGCSQVVPVILWCYLGADYASNFL